MKMRIVLMFMLMIMIACTTGKTKNGTAVKTNYDTVYQPIYPEHPYDSLKMPMAYFFDFPVGYPDMKGYSDANSFGNVTSNGRHLGADLSKPGDSDLGDTIRTIAPGIVRTVSDSQIEIIHKTTIKDENFRFRYVISSYTHCDTVLVEQNQPVFRGQVIGTVGKKYTVYAHLHFEIFEGSPDTGPSYYGYSDYHVDPVKFIDKYRKCLRQ